MPLFDGTFKTRIGGCPAGSPLLDYLASRFPYHPIEAWRERLEKGAITLDGLVANPDARIWPGQSLGYSFVGYEEPELPGGTRIIAQQGDLAMVHKPSGIPVTKTGTIFFQTLARWATQNLGDDWAPLHRLDRETSGIVAFARGSQAFKALSPESGSAWVKLYLAVVQGDLPGEAGRIDAALGPMPGDTIRSRMQAFHQGESSVAMQALPTNAPQAKPALTLWWRLNPRLVLAAPITGRKHQIRAHLAHIGCPIVGDKMYAEGGQAYLKRLTGELDAEDYARLGAHHHLLHAVYLSITGSTLLEVNDLDLPTEFGPYLDREGISPSDLQAWAQGPIFTAAKMQAAQERQTFGSRESV